MKEEVDLDESIGAAVKRAEASRQRALKKAAAMVKRGFSMKIWKSRCESR
jgi:hypothetical protein